MSKRQKKIVFLTMVFASLFAVQPSVNAMHIMEGFLTPKYCIAWGIVCLPFLAAGFFAIHKTLKENRKVMPILAMAGAYVFVLSSLKIPSVTGSCSHMTGAGLGAILFGPSMVSILGLIVLIFQAVLLAHGGITTLGANTFSMAIAGPLVSYGIYRVCIAVTGKKKLSVFLAAFCGDIFTYIVTSVQLAIAYPSADGGIGVSAAKFLSVFAPTQLPLAILEGILTVVIVIGLETYAQSELTAIGFSKEVG